MGGEGHDDLLPIHWGQESKQHGPSGKSTTVLRIFSMFFWSSWANNCNQAREKKGVNNRSFLIWVGVAFPAV
jgi:hypothetical protein